MSREGENDTATGNPGDGAGHSVAGVGSAGAKEGPWIVVQKNRRPRKGKDSEGLGGASEGVSQKGATTSPGSRFESLREEDGDSGKEIVVYSQPSTAAQESRRQKVTKDNSQTKSSGSNMDTPKTNSVGGSSKATGTHTTLPFQVRVIFRVGQRFSPFLPRWFRLDYRRLLLLLLRGLRILLGSPSRCRGTLVRELL